MHKMDKAMANSWSEEILPDSEMSIDNSNFKSKPANFDDKLQTKIQSKPDKKKQGSGLEVDKISQMESWFKENLSHAKIDIDESNFYATFQDGQAFAYIISRFRPDLLEMKDVKNVNPLGTLERVFKIADEQFNISPMFTATKFLFHPDKLEAIHYLTQWHDYFKNESANKKRNNTLNRIKNRFSIKRKHGGTKKENKKTRPDVKPAFPNGHDDQNNCRKCSTYIYTTEKISIEGFFFHRKCFTCEFTQCDTQLTSNNCSVYHNEDDTITFLCPYHFRAVDSADSAVGFNTLTPASTFADCTTEEIATKAYEVKERALTIDIKADSPTQVKAIVPIISNHESSSRNRTISQPLLDSPTLPKKPSSPQKSNYEKKSVSNSLPATFRGPKRVPKKLNAPVSPRTTDSSPALLPKVQSPQVESPIGIEVYKKPHIPLSASEPILSAPTKHKKSSYEPRSEFGGKRYFSFANADPEFSDELIGNHPTKSRNSIEVQALKTEERKLSVELAHTVDENGSSRGQVGEVKIQSSTPDLCQTVAISSVDAEGDYAESLAVVEKSLSQFHLQIEPEPGLDLSSERSARVVTTFTKENDASLNDSKFIHRPRLGIHTGQETIYRSKRNRSTSASNCSELKSVDTGIALSLVQSNSEDEDNDSDSELMQEENQKKQDAFRRALELDEKMDLVQQKIESLEEKGKYLESKMRNAEDNLEEGRYFIEWSSIIDQKKDLVRQDRDLNLEFKEHQLNDEYCRVENELRKKQEMDKNLQGVESKMLLNEKISITSELDELVSRREQERIDDYEEDERRKSILPSALENFTSDNMADVFVSPPSSPN